MKEFIVVLMVCALAVLMLSGDHNVLTPFFILCMLATVTIFSIDDTDKPTQEELVRATEQCYGQRIGDPVFRFPYDISCAQWVKVKCGNNKYTQQWIDDHIKTEKLAEEEWGN